MADREPEPDRRSEAATVSVSGTLRTVTRDPAPALAVGTSLGSFRIEGRLGSGGLGIVYRAYDEKLKRPVAIKVLADGALSAMTLLEEARSAASLTHPSIAAVYEVREHDGVAFIVMELVEGTTLRALVREGPLHPNDALHFARDIAAGLARAHKSGVVHRDLKPENVMVTLEGGVKILDFGLARELPRAGEGNEAPPSSKTGVAGTPEYMSPEQARGRRVGATSDVFSFGIVLHEMLAGTRVRARPFALPPSVPASLEAVLARCLEEDPSARYADGFDLLEALRAVSLPVPERERVAPPASRASRAAARAPALAWGGFAMAALLVTAGAAALRGRSLLGAASSAPAVPSRAAASASPPALPPPVKITDLPVPASASDEARSAYADGLLAERQGNDAAFRLAMRKATTADPEMAAAWLRLSLIAFLTSDSEGSRDAFAHVTQLEARLDDHDRSIESATAELILHDPPRYSDFASRLDDATARFPGDAEIAANYAYALGRAGRPSEGIEAWKRAMQLDPLMGDPYVYLANAQAAAGDLAAALATADLCEKNLPASAKCARPREYLHQQLGECAALEADGRTEAARDPASQGYVTVAEALATEGRPPETVRGALDLWVSHIDAAYRKTMDLEMSMLFEVWRGDFSAAERIAHDLAANNAGVASEDEQGVPLAMIAAALTEEGRRDEAARVAMQFLSRQPTWLASARYTSRGLSSTFVPSMLATARGALPSGEFERRRDAWARDWADHMTGPARHDIWFPAYANIVDTPDDAKRALEVLPDYAPLATYRPDTTWDASEGTVYLLAGDPARALPLLERGANVCLALSDPFGHTQARLHMGMAREATGDRDGACLAYAGVLAQWGQAKPRSVTADEAARRQKALGCATAR